VDRLDTFLEATDTARPEDIALRALTLHIFEHVAPRAFAARNLAAVQRVALERCATVDCAPGAPIDASRLEAGIDAWYCRHLKGLPHPPPDAVFLRAALQWLADDGQLLHAWLIGEQAARCGLDVRLPVPARPFLGVSRLHDAYFVTHLVMLDTDYFARGPTHPDAPEWADALAQFVPWLAQEPNDDLAGELALCLRFLGRDAGAALELLARAGPTDDAHAQATVLLAHSVE
jgi:D-amino peptidase